MKNATRKLIAIVMALALVMSLSITAFAANPTTGTLTVHGNELGGKNVTAVLMFTANVKSEDDLIGEGDSVGYELVAAWQEFIDGKLSKAVDANATSEEAYNYVKDLTGNALISFAEDAMKYAKACEITGLTALAAEDSDTATFTNLIAGYYVVYPDAGSTSTARGTEAMLVNVPSQMASELEIKSVYPTVDKTVDANGDNSYSEDESAQIGDTVKFQLSSEVPEMSDYATYEFNFVDTMSAGLTYKYIVNDKAQDRGLSSGVTVTIGGEIVSPSRVTYGNNVLRVEFDDLKSIEGVVAGEQILVTYEATVNSNAVVGANTNKAKVEYSNNPGFEGNPGEGPTGQSEEDDADVYTFEIVVDKYAMVDGTNTKLSGAVFTLKDKDGNVINLVAKDGENNIYRIATADDAAENIVTQVTTDANGAVKIEGLEEGTYYLEEIVAPTGYNKLAEDVKIVITADYTKTPVEVSYKVGNAEAAVSSSIPVENKTGAVLPETGSFGTIGLTIFGVMVVVLGIALPRKKNARA